MADSLGKIRCDNGATVGRSDYTFECTGVETCVQASIYATKSGGKAVLVGMGTPNLLLPLSEASAREIDIVPTWRYADCYATAAEIILESKGGGSLPDLSQLITHRFEGLEQVPTAMRTACTTQDADGAMVVKVALNLRN
ncbi:hypothetical protein LTR17_025017 [Elasticomyces elasticus]|nr:hypothetical protein LTR17_025017 [Elasticomyces elasticus]